MKASPLCPKQISAYELQGTSHRSILSYTDPLPINTIRHLYHAGKLTWVVDRKLVLFYIPLYIAVTALVHNIRITIVLKY